MNKNGTLSFSESLNETSPDPSNIIMPFLTEFKVGYGEKVMYQEVTSGPLLYRATQDIYAMFPGNYFYTTSLLIVTWEMMSFANSSGVRKGLLFIPLLPFQKSFTFISIHM